jgi:co-chaperonin GroES (HSP10)
MKLSRGKLTSDEEDALDDNLKASMDKLAKERKRLMSSARKLKLPKLLEERRQEYGITDGAFDIQPFHDRILVYQTYKQEETYGGGLIIKTESRKEYEATSCPQGVVVAAGARALDELRCNGIDLGHLVVFMRLAPWRIETDTVGGRTERLIVMRSGDIVGSMDLAESIRAGEVKVEFVESKYEHWYKMKDGRVWKPRDVEPFLSEDM